MPTVFEIVTQTIIEKLEAGDCPWKRPWVTSAPKNLISQKEYRGINTFLLSASGFPSPYFLTYAQTIKLGGNVRKGEHGQIVVFWNVGKEKLNPKTGKIQKPFLLRYYRVFNLSQTEGIQAKLGINDADSTPKPSIESCDAIVSGMPNRPAIKASDRAWYRPSTDEVGIPDKSVFNSSEAFYATLFHELTHSTGHTSRVGREGIEVLNSFGSESYSKEELIAEMGAAYLCGFSGISPATVENSAAYLRSWISVLKGDSKLIVTAASQAQRASDYIRGIAGKTVADVTVEPEGELIEA
ncbi:MAG: zincin-like metallopeptidase domain-containing protein [Candidatus Acidiferrales bacterium]